MEIFQPKIFSIHLFINSIASMTSSSAIELKLVFFGKSQRNLRLKYSLAPHSQGESTDDKNNLIDHDLLLAVDISKFFSVINSGRLDISNILAISFCDLPIN